MIIVVKTTCKFTQLMLSKQSNLIITNSKSLICETLYRLTFIVDCGSKIFTKCHQSPVTFTLFLSFKRGFDFFLQKRYRNYLTCKNFNTVFFIQRPGAIWTWLGMSDIANEGEFVWSSSGAPLNYTNWNAASGEPNGGAGENCGSYWSEGPYWNDFNCNVEVQGMCEQILFG